MVRRYSVAIALIGTMAALVASCSSGTTHVNAATTSSAPSTASTSVASAKGPKVGSCLEPIIGPVAESNQLPAIVPCSDPHGGEIVATFQIPDGPTAAYPASNGQISGADTTITECQGDATHLGAYGAFVGDNKITVPPALAQATGVTQAYRVSGLQAGMFVPGTAAWARGARWLACAAVLSNSQDVPSSYTGSAKGVAATAGGLPTQFSWCKEEADPNNPATFQTVSCAKAHNYEQIASFSAGTATTAFPGEPALDQDGTQLCAPLMSAATAGKTDHLAATLGMSWTFPQEGDWANGARVVRCFVSTRNGDSIGAVGPR